MAEWWELARIDPFGTLAPQPWRQGPLGGAMPAQRTDGKIVPGSEPGKIGLPLPPHPLSTMGLLGSAYSLSPVAAGIDLADAYKAASSAGTFGELLPALGGGALAVASMVPGMRGPVAAERAANRVQNVSRVATIFDPPNLRQRAFTEDYRNGAAGAPGDRLKYTIEGDPIVAQRVVGRQVVGGDDVALPPSELHPFATQIVGNPPKVLPAREMGGDAGRYIKEWDHEGLPVRGIALRSNLTPTEAQRVLGHEVGHAVHDFASKVTPAGDVARLRQNYSSLANQDWRYERALKTGVPIKPRYLTGPEQFGYSGAKVDQELIAEAVRAYMTNPNYFKTVAPKTAEAIRKHVNTHPHLSKYIQFNSLAPLLAAGGFGALAPMASDEERY